MKVILLRDVKNIGRKYDIKEVNDGFARNGLIGKGAALAATPENIGKLKSEIDKAAKQVSDRQELLATGLKAVSGIHIELSGRGNPEGHLFAAIHPSEICRAIEVKTGIKIEPSWLKTKGLKTTGDHNVEIEVGGKTATVLISVQSKK